MKNLNTINLKIHSLATLQKELAIWRFKGYRIVFTNGCFDLLHRGHIEYLAKAADEGDKLIIGLNSDKSVKMLDKGSNRPLQDESSRLMALAAMHFVGAVILFEEETPYNLIQFIQPDVIVKGGDYTIEQIAGHDIVLGRGGKVKLIEFLEGYSTSAIERKIKNG